MIASRILLCCLLLLGSTTAALALNDQVSREQDIVGLRLGQRVLVDDGSCGAGQIKEVSGAKMTAGWRRRVAPLHSALGTEEEIARGECGATSFRNARQSRARTHHARGRSRSVMRERSAALLRRLEHALQRGLGDLGEGRADLRLL